MLWSAGLLPVEVNLATGLGQLGDSRWVLSGIEGVRSGEGNDLLRGIDGPPAARGERFIPATGSDTVIGGTGVDSVELSGSRDAWRIDRRGDTLTATPSWNLAETDTLIGIERLRFFDQLLAFGTRAEEVAKVAFALWSPHIAGARDLFARGISFYDNGYDYRHLIEVALGYFAHESDTQIAQRLSANVPDSGRSATELLSMMQAAGGGLAGRIAATQWMADHPVNATAIEVAGLTTQGIACVLFVDGQPMFPV